MRFLGLDPGEKRIGVALSDPLGITAQPLEVITNESLDHVLNRLKAICRDYSVDVLVIGDPVHMSGERGEASKRSEAFAEKLREKLKLPVYLSDERLSSSAVEKVLISGGIRRNKRREVRDKLAAVLILENFMKWYQGKMEQ